MAQSELGSAKTGMSACTRWRTVPRLRSCVAFHTLPFTTVHQARVFTEHDLFALLQTYTHRDVPDQCPASLDWRDRKPIAGMLKELDGWDPVLLAALSHFATSLHWTILDEGPEQEWVSAGEKVSKPTQRAACSSEIFLTPCFVALDLLYRRLGPRYDGEVSSHSLPAVLGRPG